MEVPTYDQLIEPTFVALHRLGGSGSNDEIVERVIADRRLPGEVVEKPHGRGNTTELEYRLAWARTYLKKYGLLDNSERGVWSLTSEGAKRKQVDTREVVLFVRNTVRRRISSEEEALRSKGSDEWDDRQEETASWQDELLETLLAMPPDGFERLCQRLLRESGFIEVEVTGRTGDGSIDGHGILRVAGLISFKVSFQSKRHKDSIGPNVVRDFRGAMIGRADKGLLISTGTFTRDAKREATRDGAPPIDLIDGELLVDKLRQLRLGLNIQQTESIEVDTKWFQTI